MSWNVTILFQFNEWNSKEESNWFMLPAFLVFWRKNEWVFCIKTNIWIYFFPWKKLQCNFLFCCWVLVVWFIFLRKIFLLDIAWFQKKTTILWLPHNSNINSSFSWSHPISWAAVHCSHCGRGVYCIQKYILSFGVYIAY